MRQLLFLCILILCFDPVYSSEINSRDTEDSLKIKTLTQEDFIKEFGFNDSSVALINLFFVKNKRAKNQTIIGGATLVGGIAAFAVPFEPGDDQKGFGDLIRPVAEPAAVIFGAIITTAGITKLGRYTKQKLYMLLTNYKKRIPIPQKYGRKLKSKYFP